MAITKRHWYDRLYFEFWLDTYVLTVGTRLFRESYERMTYDVCRLRVEVCRKRLFEVQLYRKPLR